MMTRATNARAKTMLASFIEAPAMDAAAHMATTSTPRMMKKILSTGFIWSASLTLAASAARTERANMTEMIPKAREPRAAMNCEE